MYEKHAQMLEAALKKAEEKQGKQVLSERFFELFFHMYPQTLEFFETTDIATFAPFKYDQITGFLVDAVKHPEYADGELTDEIRRHIAFGMIDISYYLSIIDTLEMTIKEALGDEWTDGLQEHWHDAAEGMKAIILNAATHIFD